MRSPFISWLTVVAFTAQVNHSMILWFQQKPQLCSHFPTFTCFSHQSPFPVCICVCVCKCMSVCIYIGVCMYVVVCMYNV